MTCKTKKENYPMLNERKVETLVKKLQTKILDHQIKIDFVNYNKGKIALNIGLDHPGEKVLFDSEGMDSLLNKLGFLSNTSLDERYGCDCKYYLFKSGKDMWVAIGDNSYGDEESRILINWHEKLDKETIERLV